MSLIVVRAARRNAVPGSRLTVFSMAIVSIALPLTLIVGPLINAQFIDTEPILIGGSMILQVMLLSVVKKEGREQEAPASGQRRSP